MQWHDLVVPLVVAVFGALLGAGGITPVIVALTKAKRDSTQDQRDFAAAIFARMETRISQLEIAERECLRAKEEMIAQLAAFEARLESATDHIKRLEQRNRVGRITADSKGIITSWSSGAEELFGWSRDEILGKAIETIMPAYLRAAHREAFLEALKPEHVTRDRKMRDAFGQHADGSTINVTIVLNAYTGPDGSRCFDAEIYPR
jgi:PAS domain S-box-containing protein